MSAPVPAIDPRRAATVRAGAEMTDTDFALPEDTD